ncbi:MAG: sulfatase [Planctomycetota bacterium]
MQVKTKFALAVVVACLTVVFVARGFASDRPNLVVLLADDCTYRDIGCYGGQARTPHIDLLATEGMRFERCFQAAPMCSPTRHNLYTGIYPVKSGAYPNHTMIYPDVKTVVHYLQQQKYHVAHTGKLHINPKSSFPWERIRSGSEEPRLRQVDRFLAEQRQSKRPFCLFFCSTSPHSPWDQGDASVYPPESIVLPPYIIDTPVVRENFSNYLAEVSHFDSQVGAVLKLLDQHGLRDSTLVMVLSEQGNSFPFAKWTCYDHGLQSAMIVRWPQHVAAGSVSKAMVEYVDVTPTLIDIAGGQPSPDLDGQSFLPVLQQHTDHHKDHVYGVMTTRGIHNGSDAYAVRSVRGHRYKLILNLNHESVFRNVSMQTDYYQSIIAKADHGDSSARHLVDAYANRPPVELYDLDTDPLELANIADNPASAEIVATLKARLHQWMQDQGDLGVPTELAARLRQPKATPENTRLDASELRHRSKAAPLN